MKKKILVANRSEIACRIFQAAREYGLTTVGIVAPGDEESRHCTHADELYGVSSYLNLEDLLAVGKKANVQLVHPGYGFLSEQASFAQNVEEAGWIWIGPRPETMDQLGNKIKAKAWARKEGIPLLPSLPVPKNLFEKKDQRLFQKEMNSLGFPLMLKAAGGGGGKGMRYLESLEDFYAHGESAEREAQEAFGKETLFLEKAIHHPRHLEIQIFGDGKGQAIHLHERDCSLQRRHQKIWEEALAPLLSKDLKQKMIAAALRLAQASHYRGAGTVEFLVQGEANFYFLEINPRLQVEHPVTEWVTGLDLVHLQLEEALSRYHGKKEKRPSFQLPPSPEARGHAIQVRLYAEDPWQGFIPTGGQITALRWPTGAGIRVESAIEEGQTISSQWDGLLGKLIVFAETREHALNRLEFALSEMVLLGVTHNQAYLKQCVRHPRIRSGQVHVHFLEEESSQGLSGFSIATEDLELARQAQNHFRKEPLKTLSSRFLEAATPFAVSPWKAFGKSNR